MRTRNTEGTGRQLRILMLGWEYPPRFAGGLGKACQGLSQALAKSGAQVFFVLPSFPERVSQRHLEVVSASECLKEAGWEFSTEKPSSTVKAEGLSETHSESRNQVLSGNVSKIISDARLFPYGIPETQNQLSSNTSQYSQHSQDFQYSQYSIKRAVNRIHEAVTPAQKEKLRLLRSEQSENLSPSQIKTAPVSDIYGGDLWSEIEKFSFTVRHLSETHEVDLVHAHDWMTFPAAFEFQKMTGVPVFLHVHATEYDRSGENLNPNVFRIERDGFRRATHILAVSRYTAGIIERLYGIRRNKISVAYNAPEEAGHSAVGKPWGLPDFARKSQVVFLGRLTFQKGPDHFLKAASLVARVDSNARFIFCGTGDMMDKLRHQAHRLGIENQVHFAGFVEPSEVDEILYSSRVLVMPSVSEPFGLVALEAIQCGIPVVLSKQSGVREVLPRTLQVDFWDHEKLADQIIAALRLPSLAKQLVEDGKSQVKQLSWEKSALEVLEVYKRYLGKAQHRRSYGH